MITTQRLSALCPGASIDIVSSIAPPLDQTVGGWPRFRRAHFLGQIGYESLYFRRLRENLDYSASRIVQVWPRLHARAAELAHKPEALGNAVYANRLGNGDEASGDGYRFRGRGLIQLTGRDNYAGFAAIAGVDLVGNPDLAADPATAVNIAIAFWKHTGCDKPADLDDCAGVTRLINGPRMEGLAERERLTEKAMLIFV